MRIVLAFPLNQSAIARQFTAVAVQLADRGHQVTAAVAPDRGTRLEVPGIDTRRWPTPRCSTATDVRFFRRLLGETGAELIAASFAPVPAALIAGFADRTPARVAWHHLITDQGDTSWFTPLRHGRRALLLRTATDVVAVSEASAQDLVSTFRVPRTRLAVLRNAIADPGPPIPAEDRSTKIVVAARFHPSKGQDVLIRALPAVRRQVPSLVVDFYGDGPMLEECRRLAEDLGVGEATRFHGSVHVDRVQEHVAAAAVSVLPSRSDNCPLAALEALAAGTPLVASEAGGLPEILRDGLDGVLVEAERSDRLAEELVALLTDPVRRKQLGKAARRRFETAFELDGAAARHADSLEAMARRRTVGTR